MINRPDIEQFQRFLEEHDIFPSEKIGQHFLVDQETLELIANRVVGGANVIEIGPGIGNLTVPLARRAQAVFGLEIDRQFEDVLADVIKANPNVEIQFTDALRVDFNRVVDRDPDSSWQVVSNPPYHISEPLLKKLTEVHIDSAVLLVGDNLAAAMTAETPSSANYTRTSFITQAFFHPDIIANVPKSSFYPEPRTLSNVVELTPREKGEFRTDRNLAIQRQLAAPENQRFTVVKAIKAALDSMETGKSSKEGLSRQDIRQYDRRAARQELRQIRENFEQGGPLPEGRRSGHQRDSSHVIKELGLPDGILSQQFSHLDNQSVRLLAQALINKFK